VSIDAFYVVFAKKEVPDQTLEIAWLSLLAGVFNVSFSIRASGIGA